MLDSSSIIRGVLQNDQQIFRMTITFLPSILDLPHPNQLRVIDSEKMQEILLEEQVLQ